MTLSRPQKIRITVFLSIVILAFLGYYIWYYRNISILNVSIRARMQKLQFSDKVVAVLPMEIKTSDYKDLQVLFSKLYGIKIKVLDPSSLPQNALTESGQYDAASINDYLRTKKGDYFRLIGITEKDITVGAYNYLFGLASLNNGVLTISTHRLKETFYNRKKNPMLFRNRLFRIVIHEYGHTFGLNHCIGNEPCLMKEIADIEELDSFPCGFCWICNNMINPDLIDYY